MDLRVAQLAAWAVVGMVLFQSIAVLVSVTSVSVDRVEAVVGISASIAGAAVFLTIHARLRRHHPVSLWWVIALVVVAILAFVCGAWMNPALALAAVLLGCTGTPAVVLVLLILAFEGLFMLFGGAEVLTVAWYLLFTVVICAVLYVVTRLAQVIDDLTHTRELLGRLTVDRERQRISRDLHDILGRSLVAVSLRLQTALMVWERDPAVGHEQVEEASRLVVDGQAALRRVVNGETFIDLDDELTNAVELLRRIGVRVHVDQPEEVPEDGCGAGARVVREAVTNALKHARPENVALSVRVDSPDVVVEVSNDGVISGGVSTDGTGLADLRARIEALGGQFRHGQTSPDTYVVSARLPLAVADTVERETEPA